MKKTTIIALGAILSLAALTGCGKDKVTHNQPTRNDLTYDVKLHDILNGRDEFNAFKNLEAQLSSNKLSSAKGEVGMFYNYGSGASINVSGVASVQLYSNQFMKTEVSYTETEKQLGLEASFDITNTTEGIIVGNQYVEKETSNNPGGFDVDYYVCGANENADVADFMELADIPDYDGTFGIDQNGDAVYYEWTYGMDTTSAIDKNGNSVPASVYHVEELLIKFDGDAKTGRPWGIFSSSSTRACVDDYGYLTEEPQLKYLSNYNYELSYGKRSAYKGKDKFISAMKQEQISENPDVSVAIYDGATLAADGNSFSYIPNYYSTLSTSEFSDEPAKDYQSVTGLNVGENTIAAGSALKVLADVDVACIVEDPSGDLNDFSTVHSGSANVTLKNAPEGVKVITYENENYIYFPNEVDAYFEVEWKVSLTKVADANTIALTATVTFGE